MKKQINPTIKAHLIRGAFYLLLLVAVCAIPFALAQRNTAKRSVAKPGTAGVMAPESVSALDGTVPVQRNRAHIRTRRAAAAAALLGHHTRVGKGASGTR